MRCNKWSIGGVITGTVFFLVSAALAVPVTTSVYYSVDIGSDLEWSDPNQDGDEWMDPGDIYLTEMKDDSTAYKDDAKIFATDPPPYSIATAVPVGNNQPWEEMVDLFFDLDGEDQLSIAFDNIGAQGIAAGLPQGVATGLFLNPNNMLLSFDDDQAPGWFTNDVPVTRSPNHGSDLKELLLSTGWLNWSTAAGYSDETTVGLSPDPGSQEDDDDIDALDTWALDYWYWTSDHEARYGTDPGHIYVTDRSQVSSNYSLAIHKGALGFNNSENEDVDIDAFEFCVTDDSTLIQSSGISPQTAGPYLIILFSVDQDDPVTVGVDESGGLDPTKIYVSFFNAYSFPLPNADFDEDVDALALEEDARDYGDAPETNPYSYPTTKANNGASHLIDTNIYMGMAIDSERDGQPTILADGDDINGQTPDDEDGVYLQSRLFSAADNSVWVYPSCNGYLNAWIDFNADGDWADSGEQIFSDYSLTGGVTNCLNFYIPPGITLPAGTFARFRFATYTGLGYSGTATNGEVEDYQILEIALPEGDMDYGDADAIYPVLMTDDGARHPNGSSVILGTLFDAEPDGQPTGQADGDNLSMLDDEDGVSFTNMLVAGSNRTVLVFVTNPAFLYAWFDFNQDGDWQDSGEQVANGLLLAAGPNQVPVSVPANALLGPTYARFRVTTVSTNVSTTGFVADGEVEDYYPEIYQELPGSYTLTITNADAMATGAITRVDLSWNAYGSTRYQVSVCTNTLTDSPLTWTPLWPMPTATNQYTLIYTNGPDNAAIRIKAPYAVP